MTKPPIGIDSIGIVDLGSSNLPSFAPATGHFWDLSGASYNDTSIIEYLRGQNQFQFADSLGYAFDSVHFKARGMSYYVLQGRIRAKEIVDTQTQLVPTHTNRVDTIFYNYQEVFYNNPYYIQPYPMTYPMNPWNTNYAINRTYGISDNLLHLNHTAMRHYTGFNEDASIIGWGGMFVNSLIHDTGVTHPLIKSDSLWVIQVQRTSYRVDSIIMPNIDTSVLHHAVSLYDTFHVQKAYFDTIYERDFYRLGSITPLVRVLYDDAAFTSVKRVEVHVQNLQRRFQDTIGTAVNNIYNQEEISIYPNPVTNASFNINVPESNSNWSYQVMNISGQVITSGELERGQSKKQITLPSVPTGTYIIGILKDGKPFGARELQVFNR